MADRTYTPDEESEQHRLERVEERGELNGDPAPGSMYCHEALDRVSLLSGLVDEQLLGHPSIQVNPEWFKTACVAFDALWDLYQAIGAVHLNAKDPNQ